MRFLYVFALMFLGIFGLAVLLRTLYCALLGSGSRRFDVCVNDEGDLEEFLASARRSAFIGRVTVITDRSSDELKPLLEKYGDMGIIVRRRR